jgi:hypothetical protein
MKAKLSLFLLSSVGIVLSYPYEQTFLGTGSSRRVLLKGQVFDVPTNPQPGFSLNLDELRLVQLSEGQEPVWMTELEKVKIHCIFGVSTHRSPLRLRLKPKDFISSTCTNSLSSIECWFFIYFYCLYSTDNSDLSSSVHSRLPTNSEYQVTQLVARVVELDFSSPVSTIKRT